MSNLEIIAVVAVLVIGALARLALPFIQSFTFREIFRSMPEARSAFVGSGWWIKLSERFGLPYIVSLLTAPFIWIIVAPKFIPDTTVGAWLVFGPAIICLVLGCFLLMLRRARWEVDE